MLMFRLILKVFDKVSEFDTNWYVFHWWRSPVHKIAHLFQLRRNCGKNQTSNDIIKTEGYIVVFKFLEYKEIKRSNNGGRERFRMRIKSGIGNWLLATNETRRIMRSKLLRSLFSFITGYDIYLPYFSEYINNKQNNSLLLCWLGNFH